MRTLAAVLILPLAAGPASAKLLLSQKDALALAFPAGAAVEKKTAFLTPDQVRSAEKLASARVETRLWTYYVGKGPGGTAAYAYFDRVLIRTMPATLMVALDASGKIRFIEILSFDEPEDYLPMARWLDLFKGKGLDEDLRVRGGIRNIAGASLSAAAVAESARRILALHRVIHP